jgi:CHAT domain-containing protein/tetratricopeptide (TPR) repeat protein
MAQLYQLQVKYAEAEPLFKRSLEIYEKALGKDHPNVGTSLAGLAELYRAQGKYADAEPLYKRSLEILEKALGKDHPSVAQALNNLAGLYQLQGKYSDAEPLFNRGLAIREKALGKDHPDVAESANNLAVVYQSQGKYADAEPLYKRSLEINEKALGKDHPQVATALNNLAGLYQSQGKYADAEPLFYMSLEIKEKALGKDHPNVAISLNNLAVLYRKQGKHSDAEPLYKRSLQVFEKALGKDHPDVAAFLNNLGGLYQDKGDYAEALRMFQESLEISKKKGLPLDNPQNLIANLYLDQGEVTKAEPIIAEAGENRTRARLCLMKKDFQKAKDYYDGDRILAEENRNADYLFSAYTGLGIASEGLGDDIHAAEYYRQAVDFTEDLRSSLSRDDRDKFFDVKVNGLYRTAPYEGLARVLTKLNKPEDALKESEYAKARIFAEWLSRKSEGSAPQVPKDVTDKDSQLNERLAALTRNLQEAYGKANKEVITVLKPQVGEAKDKLAAHVDMLRKQYPLFAATKYPHPMVLAQTDLKENEWVLAYHVTDPGIIIYLTRGKILIRGLFKPIPRKDVDELVRKFLQPMELGPDDSITEKLGKFDFGSGNELADLLLADILPDIPKNTPLIIIPDGSLGVVPFEMLVLNDGGKIVTDDKRPQTSGAEFFGDRNPISYYQSITALTLARTLGKQKKTQDRLLVIADPVFEMKDARAQGKKSETKLTGTEASFYEDLMASVEEGKVGGLRFTRLPLTGELAENLSTSFKGACTLYTGLKANKDTFMKEVVPSLGDYSKVVFATHGYFGKGLPGINEPVLVFTLVPPGTDGYLRMSEVMGLKMNADMVALTACQTGLGKELSGEGVMGMGRAFQFAGAKSVLMSLWSVSEKSSTTLVENFFKNLKDGKNKLEALKLAREDIRQQGYDHPFYWAGFILVGEVN